MVGMSRVPEHAHPAGCESPAEIGSALRTRCGAGEQGGLVAWQPPHRQDEDLVPLTAGACSPYRMSSRRIPRQTTRPDPSPHDSSGAASRRHRATPEPGPDATAGRPTGSLGEAALSCVRIGSEPIWLTARARPQVSSGQETRRSTLRATGPLPPPYRSTPNTASRVRQLGGPTSVGRASSIGGAQRPGHAPPALIGVARIAERARCSGWFVATRAGYSPTARQQAGPM
jgi:hypothetical protein